MSTWDFPPPGLLVKGLIVLPKELPAGTALYELPNLWLMFISLTKRWYSELQNPEKAQLCVFLEKYLRFCLVKSNGQMEKLSDREMEQFDGVFDLEYDLRCSHFMPGIVPDFTNYLYGSTKLGCPASFLEQKFDFCFEKTFSKDEEKMDARHALLMALIKAREMVREDVDFETGRVGERPGKELACLQIKRAIKECNKKIGECFRDCPGLKKNWEETPSGKLWAALKEKSKEACADLGLSN